MPDTNPRIGSACSGYGGLDLGLMDVVGGSVAWHVEYDKDPSAVLDARFPGVPNYGGYPCQPFSHERHLWPAVAHAVSVLRPGRVLLENVRGHVSLGLDAVLADLAGLGYDATWGVVRAADAGAPHGRARIFIVATDTSRVAGSIGHGDDVRTRRTANGRRQATGRGSTTDARSGSLAGPASAGDGLLLAAQCGDRATADTDRTGRSGVTQLDAPAAAGLDSEHRGHVDGCNDGPDWGAYTGAIRRWEALTGRPAPRPTEPATRGGERLSPRFVEWMMGLPAGWVTDVLPRNPALKALGNGVVPQQAALALRLLLPTDSALAEVS